MLGKFSGVGILAGGTAITLQIGHRLSYDFDIFTSGPITENIWNKVKRVFGSGCARTLQTKTQLNFLTPKSVRVTFYHAGFPPLFPTIKTNSLDLYDLKDLATNKAYTVGRRGKWRDYIDLYFLLKEKKISLGELVNLTKRRYGDDFSEKLFLEQLIYFRDIKKFSIDFCRDETAPENVQKFLIEDVKKLTDSLAIS
ncbi:MAG: nucleotidyl transferase AbiEii/AbiGii toxin family protein [Patescibacteria group bacterium]